MKTLSIILAAGMGKRMKSDLPKVLHRAMEKPMLQWVLEAARDAGVTDHVAVIGHGRELVQSTIEFPGIRWAVQTEQLGTGHAVMCAKGGAEGFDRALILCGDTPCLKASMLQDFLTESQSDVTVLSTRVENPAGYGRILRKEDRILGIREHKDCSDAELLIDEINTGIYAVRLPLLFELLQKVDRNNSQGEYYLTDILTVALNLGHSVEALCMEDPDQFLGVNTIEHLAEAEKILRARQNS